ncbi:hypothetical protein UR09_06720 [Candidatus Nitromaritima sp. SCGC AAA799-A02]|nr:hypothetical protein UR09_06720 [Candidatus Nitromaritima sp. SCGC AAA799-A02]
MEKKLLEKGGKFMVTHEADVIKIDEEYFLVLKLPDNKLKIAITQDLPKDVQKVFNDLIVSLKNGIFNFSLNEQEDKDIYYHVAKEYISQLNSELDEIYKEMKEYNLLDADNDE